MLEARTPFLEEVATFFASLLNCVAGDFKPKNFVIPAFDFLAHALANQGT